MIGSKGFSSTKEAGMTCPVLVQPANGQLAATLVGAPEVRATAATRAEALTALEADLERRVAQGELLAREVRGRGVSRLAGKYRDDPSLPGDL